MPAVVVSVLQRTRSNGKRVRSRAQARSRASSGKGGALQRGSASDQLRMSISIGCGTKTGATRIHRVGALPFDAPFLAPEAAKKCGCRLVCKLTNYTERSRQGQLGCSYAHINKVAVQFASEILVIK